MASVVESAVWTDGPADLFSSFLYGESSSYAESSYETLADYALDVLIVIDESGRIHYSNAAAKTVLGYRRADLAGRDFFALVREDDRADIRMAVLSAADRDLSSGVVEGQCRHHDGRWLVCELVARFQRDAAGQPIRIVTLRDVSARAKLEERCRRVERLEIAGRMTAALTHDLNNVMTVIGGHSDLLDDNSSTKVQSIASEIRTAADRATSLTRQLLMFARQGSIPSRSPRAARTVDVNDAVVEIVAMLERVLGAGIQVTCRLHATRSVVALDRGRLDQALMNLMLNARDAMPDGGRLTIATREAGAGECEAEGLSGAHLVIDVSDTGTGMTPEIQAQMFDAFFTTKGAAEGTGLGLYTVAEIVQEGRGEISVDSAVGYGSRFRIRLPLTDAAALAAPAVA